MLYEYPKLPKLIGPPVYRPRQTLAAQATLKPVRAASFAANCSQCGNSPRAPEVQCRIQKPKLIGPPVYRPTSAVQATQASTVKLIGPPVYKPPASAQPVRFDKSRLIDRGICPPVYRPAASAGLSFTRGWQPKLAAPSGLMVPARPVIPTPPSCSVPLAIGKARILQRMEASKSLSGGLGEFIDHEHDYLPTQDKVNKPIIKHKRRQIKRALKNNQSPPGSINFKVWNNEKYISDGHHSYIAAWLENQNQEIGPLPADIRPTEKNLTWQNVKFVKDEDWYQKWLQDNGLTDDRTNVREKGSDRSGIAGEGEKEVWKKGKSEQIVGSETKDDGNDGDSNSEEDYGEGCNYGNTEEGTNKRKR